MFKRIVPVGLLDEYYLFSSDGYLLVAGQLYYCYGSRRRN